MQKKGTRIICNVPWVLDNAQDQNDIDAMRLAFYVLSYFTWGRNIHDKFFSAEWTKVYIAYLVEAVWRAVQTLNSRTMELYHQKWMIDDKNENYQQNKNKNKNRNESVG